MSSGRSLCYCNSLSVTWSQDVPVSCGTCKMGAPRRQVSLLPSTPAAPSSHLYTWLVFNTCYLFIYFYYYSWHIIVSVYSMVTWHLSALRSDHHCKSSNCHLTKLLHDWLYFLCFRLHTPWLMYFITRSLYLLIFTLFTLPPSLPCRRPSVSSLYLHICFVLFVHLFHFSDSTYKWNLAVFVFVMLLNKISQGPLTNNVKEAYHL